MNDLDLCCKNNRDERLRQGLRRFELQKNEPKQLKRLSRARNSASRSVNNLSTAPRNGLSVRRAGGRPRDSIGRGFPQSFCELMSQSAKGKLPMDRSRRLEAPERTMLRWVVAVYVVTMTGLAHSAGSSATLTAVKARGVLVCGVNEGLPGFSNVDERGMWTGFDVDFCRAIAAAVFGVRKRSSSCRYPPMRVFRRCETEKSTYLRGTPHGRWGAKPSSA